MISNGERPKTNYYYQERTMRAPCSFLGIIDCFETFLRLKTWRQIIQSNHNLWIRIYTKWPLINKWSVFHWTRLQKLSSWLEVLPLDKPLEKLMTMTEDLLQGEKFLFLLYKQHDFYAPEYAVCLSICLPVCLPSKWHLGWRPYDLGCNLYAKTSLSEFFPSGQSASQSSSHCNRI